ncbi:glutamine--fructose-6-phosphate transaminase (isomerizing) [Pedosphaera parvula]|uniref:Glutamine--fructose-6-phosphate aminotransferase [isomerizing] n=1 Tax=Pedosphaera parvula (strain Ellin514) TaxID=320771 RepID=B9XMJ2_PEDPL|nr:glutamine--fructose-6-phosphate transaminase (isomerizing) [Pedosphaera parvula]EEF58891.1 glucosamine/fructose-6-phosphate aminotransferase, isomerizing [Pedosphaera parvula Ellin514]
MCGIVGYIGKQSAAPIILEGLRRLEYRGYDSAGMSVLNGHGLEVRKKKGKIEEGLGKLLKTNLLLGQVGVGHTRWATHGEPSDENSHPHFDHSGKISVVHNGVVENYDRLKDRHLKAGHTFQSSTDTEVLAHLIGEHYERIKRCETEQATQNGDGLHPLTKAVTEALREVIGTYGIAVICADYPEVIVGARRGSPLIVGIGDGEHFLASDATAIALHTRQVIYLNDYDVVTLRADRFAVTSLGSDIARVQISQLEFSPEQAEKGEFEHFMLKEIFEQPRTVANAMRGRIDLEEGTAKFGGLNMSVAELRAIDQIVITACGTSWHAALVGEYLFEELAHIPVEVEYASEFRYRNAPIEKNTLVLAITQSGETADTLASLRETKRRGHKVLAICNVVGSTIAREADGGIYLHAGPEIGVASTKAFTSQVTVLSLLALFMGRIRMLSLHRGEKILKALQAVPDQMERMLEQNGEIRRIAQRFASVRNFFFLGRQYNFPVALEGALKLKEISYIHAEGYPAAEMKHGPIALIDDQTPSVVIIPSDAMYEKTLSNLEVVRARKGPVIAIATEGNEALAKQVDEIIYLPQTLEAVFPLLAVVPLQLLAYHVAVARGCDVDKPRNLAKSVTVE